MLDNELLRSLKSFEREAKEMRGWNLNYQPRQLIEGPPWNYIERARSLFRPGSRLLDIGTGGGEVLNEILDGIEAQACAIEEYLPNIDVASENLEGRARVVGGQGEVLPFDDASFDIALSRHTAIEPSEIARVLDRNGRFLTQQVIPDYLYELREFFPEMTTYPDHFREYQEGLEACGLTIADAREFRSPLRFESLGHLVYLLTAAPFIVPDFSVEGNLAQLEKIDGARSLEFTGGYYIIDAYHR